MAVTDIYSVFYLTTEVRQRIHSQLIFYKGAKNTQRRKDSLLNGAEKNRYSHAKEGNHTPILHNLQKLTQNGLQT